MVTEAPEPAAEIARPGPRARPRFRAARGLEPGGASEPEPEPEVVAAPPVAEWIEPVAEEIPAPAPEPVFIPEPAVAPEPADLHDQSLALAGLAPLLEGLRPLTRVSDRTGVTPRLLVLMRLLADGPLSVTEQAQRLEVSRPVVADLSARLESMGLAQRERDADDRRRVRIALTDRGRRVCDDAPPAPDPAAIEAALARMDAGERDGLILGLRALERLSATR